jgi:hypothetical protein
MRAGNPIETLHSALAHAQYAGLSPIEYEDRDWEHYRKTKEDRRIKKMKRPTSYEYDVYAMFPQTWSSTALGFGGIGGQAFTTAYVVVVECQGQFAVYFGGRHAYTIDNPNEQFFVDLTKHCMADVKGATNKYSTNQPTKEQP